MIFFIMIMQYLQLFLFFFFQFLFVNKWFAQHLNTILIPLKFHLQILAEISEGKFSSPCGSVEQLFVF